MKYGHMLKGQLKKWHGHMRHMRANVLRQSQEDRLPTCKRDGSVLHDNKT